MQFNPVLQNILNTRGHLAIHTIGVFRIPIFKAISILGNAVTFGQINRILKKYGHDHFFHVGIVFHLANGFTLSVERNETVQVRYVNHGITNNGSQIKVASYTPYTLTIGQFFENVWNKYGPSIEKYDVRYNNCQAFVQQCLTANGLFDARAKAFTYQDAVKEISPFIAGTINKIVALARWGRQKFIDPNIKIRDLVPISIMANTIYINASTNYINTSRNPTTTGQKNDFAVSIPTITLKSTDYTVSVVDFRYPTVDLTGSMDDDGNVITATRAKAITPLIQCSIIAPIIVNGSYGSLFYKALHGSDSYDYHIDRAWSLGNPIFCPLAQANIGNIAFKIVRSDNGQLYPFDYTGGTSPPSDLSHIPVSILLQITPNATVSDPGQIE